MTYSRTNLQDAIWDPLIDDQIANIVTVQNVMNETVRDVIAELDLRSMHRRVASSPNLFDDEYDYSCPTDLKGIKICDLVPQMPRPRNSQWNLVTPEEFDRRKSFEKFLVAFRDNDMLRKLRVAVPHGTDFKDIIIDPLDTLTSGGGTWVAVGDAQNLRADDVDFIQGSGSIEWDIGTGGTGKAGIQNTNLNTFDLTDYITAGSLFTWAKLTQTTNVTSFSLEIGNDTSNYYKKTVTTDNAGNAFVLGWNLLRFDLPSAIQTGTVTITACKYASLYMNSSAAITSVANWRFDMMRVQIGRFYDLLYYSKYGWQTSGGTYIENTSTTTDMLVADTDEFDLFRTKGRMRRATIEKDWDSYKVFSAEYDAKKKTYLMNFPSDALLLTQTHYDFNAILESERDDQRSDSQFTG